MAVKLDFKSEIKDKGYIFLPRYKPEDTGSIVANQIGRVLKLGSGSSIHLLVPKCQSESPPNTYSGNFGNRDFPFHTDLAHWRYPPRYLFLRCYIGSKDVRTEICDGLAICTAIGITNLKRGLVRPRRKIKGELPLLHLYNILEDGSPLIRWDKLFLQPASKNGEAAFEAFQECIEITKKTNLNLCHTGDTLVVDNWRMLHARSSVPDSAKDRKIERAYMEEVF